jgi:hypothetical protein
MKREWSFMDPVISIIICLELLAIGMQWALLRA